MPGVVEEASNRRQNQNSTESSSSTSTRIGGHSQASGTRNQVNGTNNNRTSDRRRLLRPTEAGALSDIPHLDLDSSVAYFDSNLAVPDDSQSGSRSTVSERGRDNSLPNGISKASPAVVSNGTFSAANSERGRGRGVSMTRGGSGRVENRRESDRTEPPSAG